MAECNSIESLLNKLINKVNALSAPNTNDYVTRSEFNAEISRIKNRQDVLDGLLQSLKALVDTQVVLLRNLIALVDSLRGIVDQIKNSLAELTGLLLQKIAELLGLINNRNLEARIAALEAKVNQLEQEYMSGINSVKGAALAAISESKTFSIQAIGQEKEFAIKEIEQKLAIAFFVGTGAIVLAQTTAIATIGAATAGSTEAIGLAAAAGATVIGGAAAAATAVIAGSSTTAVAVIGASATAAATTIAAETVAATGAIATTAGIAAGAIATQSGLATLATNLLRIAAIALINQAINRAIDKILNTEPKTIKIREPYPVTTIERVNIPQPFQVTQTNTITKVEVIERPFPIVKTNTVTNVQIVEVPKPYPVTQVERVVIPQIITQTNTQIERVNVPQLVTQTNTITKIQTVTVPQIVVQTKTEVKTVDKQIVVTKAMTCAELKQCEETATATIKTFKECKDGKPVFESKTITVPKADKDSIESISNKLADIEAQKCTEREAIALVPEWWQQRAGQIPQLVVRFQNVNDDGSIGQSAWSLTIPHYFKDQNFIPKFPIYKKGDIQGILLLSDSSKLTVNCTTSTEAKRLISAIKQYINPEYLKGSSSKITERFGASFSNATVKAVTAKFFPDGQKNTIPAWTIKLR